MGIIGPTALTAEQVTEANLAKAVVEQLFDPAIPSASRKVKSGEAVNIVGTESVMVYISLKGKAEETEYEVLVDGKPIILNKAEVLTAASVDFSHSFIVKALGKFEVKMIKGVLAEEITVVEQVI